MLGQEKAAKVAAKERDYLAGFCGAGPDLFPGNPGTLLVS
jgi:hypothetical protein